MQGLVGMEKLNGEKGHLTPFPPGTFEEYSLTEDGKTTLIRQEAYHKPGDRPKFLPFIPYEGNKRFYSLHTFY